MSQVYRVGRDRENDIVIDDATVSRAHAEVRLETTGGALLVDLHSTNGTCVREGNKWIEIDRATVDSDERILIGDVVTTVDALLAKRDALLAAYENRLAEEQLSMPDVPKRQTDDQPDPPSLERPLPAPPSQEPSSLRNSARHLSRRLANDFARLVFRPGRGAGDRSADLTPHESNDAAQAEGANPPRLQPIATERSAPSFRLENDHEVGAGRESSSLIARRIGEQIGRRERLPSIQVEPNPARRIQAERTEPRRWVKPAVLSMAASMVLIAGIAAVAIHGPSRNGAPGAVSKPLVAANSPKTTTPSKPPAKDRPTNVVGRATGGPLPAGMLAFGGSKVDSFRAVAALKGGGFLAVGSTESAGAGGFDLWMVRLDQSGRRLWEKRFGGEADDYGLAVAATADGGALVAGAADNRRFIWVLRTDDKGDVLWSRRIEAGYRGHATSISVTRDGFAVAAVVESKKGASITSVVVRLDKDGGTMWRQSFGPRYNWISSIRATYGAFVITGVTKTDASDANALWVAKLNRAGKIIWSKRLA
ncbi:MAG: FHA domain-containing protein, partial [Pseudomonadota bacterium]